MSKLPTLALATTRRISVAFWVTLIWVCGVQSAIIFYQWKKSILFQINAWTESLPKSVLSPLNDRDFAVAASHIKIAYGSGLFSCISLTDPNSYEIVNVGCVDTQRLSLSKLVVTDSSGEPRGVIWYQDNWLKLASPMFYTVMFSWLFFGFLGLLGRFWLGRKFSKDFSALSSQIAKVNQLSHLTQEVDSAEDSSKDRLSQEPPAFLEQKELEDSINTLLLTLKEYKSEVEKAYLNLAKEKEKGLVNAAIARTTQGLSHDIRRPFSMLRMAFDAFESARSPAEAQIKVREILPEVNRAMASVDGLLLDIMQIGASTKLKQEEILAEALLRPVVEDLFRIFSECELEMEYQFQHTYVLYVDSIQVSRVFSNILMNAAQASQGQGKLWIHTRDREKFVEFRLGNEGSVIPKDSLARLFEAFFTEGKKGGTGLGLAIAQKVITDHGGTIRCESDVTSCFPRGYVEFIFTLPMGRVKTFAYTEPLARYSREFRLQTSPDLSNTELEGESLSLKRELEIQQNLIEKLAQTKQKNLTLLLVDDEPVYRNWFLSLFQKEDKILSQINLVFAKNSKEALQSINERNPFLVIEDIDLGPHSDNGIEVIGVVRKNGFNGKICLHSNRFLADDKKDPSEFGADFVVPKPMNRSQLFWIVFCSLPVQNNELQMSNSGIKIAYLDDTKTYTQAWKIILADEVDLDTFSKTSTFLEQCDSQPGYLNGLDAVVTDLHFSPDDAHSGVTLAEELRRRGYTGPILLSTNDNLAAQELNPHFTKAIGKQTPSIEEITSWLKNVVK